MSRLIVLCVSIGFGLLGCRSASAPQSTPPPQATTPGYAELPVPITPEPTAEAADGPPENSEVHPLPMASDLATEPADPPAEISEADPPAPESRDAVVQPTSHSVTEAFDPRSVVLARVNGTPIFLSDVLAIVGPELARQRDHLSPDDLRRQQQQHVRAALRNLVQRRVLLDQAERELKEQQIHAVRQSASQEFQKRLDQIMRQMGVSTESEFNARLNDQGLSVEKLRKQYEDDFVARQFLQMKVRPESTLTRRDLLEYYQQHRSEFERPARARWQQIEVAVGKDHQSAQVSSSGAPTEEAGAGPAACSCQGCQKAQRLKAALDAGADFDDLARQESEGPRAAEGGHWGWTNRGSLANVIIDRAIFTLPVGQTSAVLQGDGSLHIVRVLERDAGGLVPFEDAQEPIRTALRQQKLREATDQYLEELMSQAYVETPEIPSMSQ